MWEGEEPGPSEGGPTPKQRLQNWIQGKCPDIPIKNFTTDWNDGKAIGALVDAVGPGKFSGVKCKGQGESFSYKEVNSRTWNVLVSYEIVYQVMYSYIQGRTSQESFG